VAARTEAIVPGRAQPQSAPPRQTAASAARRAALADRQLPIAVTVHVHASEAELALAARIGGRPGDESELARLAQQLISRSGLQLAEMIVNGRRVPRPGRR
jgi:hypothetical protein